MARVVYLYPGHNCRRALLLHRHPISSTAAIECLIPSRSTSSVRNDRKDCCQERPEYSWSTLKESGAQKTRRAENLLPTGGPSYVQIAATIAAKRWKDIQAMHILGNLKLRKLKMHSVCCSVGIVLLPAAKESLLNHTNSQRETLLERHEQARSAPSRCSSFVRLISNFGRPQTRSQYFHRSQLTLSFCLNRITASERHNSMKSRQTAILLVVISSSEANR
ncbi:hypothetical protein LX32DRAFT_223321 [Colletotrichum zoysiae]|uniref:Uncharacterized protein n=1 Tax=Colletotrichum zoysiae TaxID=1216348 RepID=A0AAD9H5J8_9PEZI|nr:hypothetical protein LX32DRAFT_223321 [Colletotrichum zoysiae]